MLAFERIRVTGVTANHPIVPGSGKRPSPHALTANEFSRNDDVYGRNAPMYLGKETSQLLMQLASAKVIISTQCYSRAHYMCLGVRVAGASAHIATTALNNNSRLYAAFHCARI